MFDVFGLYNSLALLLRRCGRATSNVTRLLFSTALYPLWLAINLVRYPFTIEPTPQGCIVVRMRCSQISPGADGGALHAEIEILSEIPPDLADSRDNAASDNGTSSILGNTIFAIRQDGGAVQTYGQEWRFLIANLRSMARNIDVPTTVLLHSATAHEDSANLSNSIVAQQQQGFRHFLSSGQGSRRSRFHIRHQRPCFTHLNLQLDSSLNMALDGGIYDSCISAPSEYSQLDIVDLFAQLGEEFLAQSSEGSPGDLDTAIFFCWLAVNTSYDDQSRYLSSLHDLARILMERFHRSHSPDDMRQTIYLMQVAYTICKEDHALANFLLADLAKWLYIGYTFLGVVDDLDEALEWCRRAIVASPLSDRHSLHFLANACGTRFELVKSGANIDEAIELARRVISLCPLGEPERFKYMHNLASHLHFRFLYLGAARDLEEAIQIYHQVLDLNAREFGGNDREASLFGLSSVLGTSYKHFRKLDDLSEGIRLQREALSLSPLGHPGRYHSLAMLAAFLDFRFQHLGILNDSDEAISLHREAITLSPRDRLHHPSLLCQFASILCLRGVQPPGDFGLLNEAIQVSQDALGIAEQRKDREAALYQLTRSYLGRFKILGQSDDETAALNAAKELMEIGEKYSYQGRSPYLIALAGIYLRRDSPFFDLSTGLRLVEISLEDTHCSAQLRLQNASDALGVLKSVSIDVPTIHQLLRVYLKATLLLPEVAHFGLDLKSRLRSLKGWGGMANYVATLLSAISRHAEAVQAIELGRAVFWSQAVQLRSKFDELPEELHHRLFNLSRQLERDSYSLPKVVSQNPTPDVDSHVDNVRRLRYSQDFDRLVQEVRERPGFERFMQMEFAVDLAKVAEKGPVVVLIADANICLAQIITAKSKDESNVLPIKLDVTQQALRQMAVALRSATAGRSGRQDAEDASLGADDQSEGIEEPDSDVTRLGRPSKAGTQDVRILKILWEKIVKVVLDALEIQPSCGRIRPRLWWCPTGAFTSLPLHAAGIYTERDRCCSDFIVSSYTPTLGALLKARSSLRPIARKSIKVLLAAVPNPKTGEPLRGTVAEVNGICAVVPEGNRINLPAEEDCRVDSCAGVSVQTLLNTIEEATILHMACHGEQDADDPLRSGFEMQEGKLPISKLMPLDLEHSFLAYLSACETAKGDLVEPDQTVHLAATMLFTGFKSVIGTMWLMRDDDGPTVAKVVYKQLFSQDSENLALDPDDVPYALDDAVRKLRETGCPPHRWAAFIHLGV